MLGVNKMRKKFKLDSLLPLVYGILFIAAGFLFLIFNIRDICVRKHVGQLVELREGNSAYKIWKNIDLQFKIYLFHTTNPFDVSDGAKPKLIQKGPYVYDENIRKEVVRIYEDTDEIEYYVYRNFRFNQLESGNNKETDKITLLNSPYVTTIGAIAALAPAFVPKIGASIHKLFPDMDDIFLRTTVRDILFEGLPLICDKEKFKELALVCSQLESRKSPLLEPGKNPGEYKFSLFRPKNGTAEGPYKMYRGIKDKSKLGVLSSFMGKRESKFWNTKECNEITGSDAVSFPPMPQRLQRVSVFIPDMCRIMFADYEDDVIIHGLSGHRYRTSGKTWDTEEIECYCPMNRMKKTVQCPPRGILDITKCKEVPAFVSEPHFTNGEQSLLDFAQGLSPDNDLYSTFVVIEPLTGAPLSGSKKIQINTLLSPQQVEMLANVSYGYFPVVWIEEGKVADIEILKEVFQAHRMLYILDYLVKVPIVVGVFIIFSFLWLILPSETKDVKIISKNNSPLFSRERFQETFKHQIRNQPA